jgi:hypothetical protein
MRKEKTLNSINARLTDSEYDEYLRLGGITWFRLYLRHSAELKATVDIQNLDKENRRKARQNLRYHSTVPERATQVVASKWQPVKAIIQAKVR